MKNFLLKTMSLLTVLVLVTSFSCAKGKYGKIELLGSGATFPLPVYQKMFNEYNKLTGAKVNYQGIGSGGGVKQITEKTVDFGATDAFLSDKELSKVGAEIVHIPVCLGAVVLSYNIPGAPKLRLTSELISDIFLGKITKWNDEKIAKENPEAKLPDLAISVISRSDGSGTTFVFTDYLSKASKEWNEKVGMGKSVTWPVGISGKGNPGVAGLISQVSGSIGYIELIYAVQNKMSYADIKNKSGNYITPSLESTSKAAAIDIPDDTRVSITDTDASDGYPISSLTWIILYKEQK
ncbi:MAG TPA: phosphate ABC transporter substrate-binding protein PstS, partial [Spirochaetota bacterium]|nr:phosphate ABC transporter substrate-binding protein PstS [Spirochaetota bacterium]